MEKFTIAKDAMFNGWPDVAMTESGELLCVFTECESHTDRRNSSLVLVRSSDRGRTWSKKTKISETSLNGENIFNNARIQRMKDGRMRILCDRLPTLWEESSHAQVYMWEGGKDGVFETPPKPLEVFGIVPDKILETASGEMLLAAHHKDEKTGKLVQYVYFSKDGGTNWENKTVVAADPRYNLCEATLLEVEPNVIMAIMRENSMQGFDAMKAISYDGGHTFEGPYPMPIPGCHRPVAGFLNDGSVMISCRYHQGGVSGAGAYQNTFLVFTRAADLLKKRWEEQETRIFPLDYDRSPNADIGYTGWVQWDDGEIYVVNYLVDDWNKGQIRGYSVKKSDFLL